MKKINGTCECCGGNSFKRINGKIIECEYCGTQYENETYGAGQRYVGSYNIINIGNNNTIKNSTISINSTNTEELENEEKESRRYDGMIVCHLIGILISFGIVWWGIDLMRNCNTNGKILAFVGITMFLGSIGSLYRKTSYGE